MSFDTAVTLAHTGHALGGAFDGFLHPITGPDHVLAMVAVGIVAALAHDRRVAWGVPAAFLGGMVLGGAAGMAGISVPAVEVGIALSIVALGLLVASGRRVPAIPMLAIAAVFGAVHGHAHGAEAPDAASPLAYVAGFVLATALLHGTGVVAGTQFRRVRALQVVGGTALAAGGAYFLLGG